MKRAVPTLLQVTGVGSRQLLREVRIEGTVAILVTREPALTVIRQNSGLSGMCFVAMSVRTLAEKENPLADYAGVVGALKGNVFITKSWHDLERERGPPRDPGLPAAS